MYDEMKNDTCPMALVKWSEFSNRASLQAVYDALKSQNIPTVPSREEALRSSRSPSDPVRRTAVDSMGRPSRRIGVA